jgi:FkbM family methyltransferase
MLLAVEPNPDLAQWINDRFSSEVFNGKLAVENVALVDKRPSGLVDFYINKNFDVNSSLNKPAKPGKHQKVSVIGMLPSDLVKKYCKQGDELHYIKIDLEGYDAKVLSELFRNKIYPNFISAEFQCVDVFAQFVLSGKYNAFKLGDRVTKNKIYGNKPSELSLGFATSGRFGIDLPTEWLDADSFFYFLALNGEKGIDIHASLMDLPNISIGSKYSSLNSKYLFNVLKIRIIKNISRFVEEQRRRIIRFLRKSL